MNDCEICISVRGESAGDLISRAERASRKAGIVELRIDSLPHGEIARLFELAHKLPFRSGTRTIFTFRPSNGGQGGFRSISSAERSGFWRSATSAGAVDIADIESDFDDASFEKSGASRCSGIIFSHHFFDSPPDPASVRSVYDALCAKAKAAPVETRAIVKIAASCVDITDSIWAWDLSERAVGDGVSLIPIAMGEAGAWTRVLGGVLRSPLTYAADGDEPTAPAQFTAEELNGIFRVAEHDDETDIYGIVGNPVRHSLSPVVHNAAFASEAVNAVYVPLPVIDLDAFIERMAHPSTREIGWRLKGFSVTHPHKIAVAGKLEKIGEAALSIGAVNTVVVDGDALVGRNTDAEGFLAPLRSRLGELSGVNAGVIGAGGAARAVVYGLAKEGARVTVHARNEAAGSALAAEFGARFSLYDRSNSSFGDAEILVNTTPLGSRGAFENDTPATADRMKNLLLAYDLVYNPKRTRFLKEAENAGIACLGGLDMFLSQAALQFEIWTGVSAPTEIMPAAVRKLAPRLA